MKKQMSILMSAFVLMFLFFITSCKDPCEDVNCNNGDCIDGVCECEDGYIGEFCDVRIIEKFFGTFDYSPSCDSLVLADPRDIRIEDYEGAPFIMNIIGFWYDPGGVAEATLQPNHSDFRIERQPFSFIWEIEGNGSLSDDNNTITFAYKIYTKADGIKVDECQGTMHRKN